MPPKNTWISYALGTRYCYINQIGERLCAVKIIKTDYNEVTDVKVSILAIADFFLTNAWCKLDPKKSAILEILYGD